MNKLYPDITYFQLAQPLPGADIGATVQIIDADGRECLKVNNIELPYHYAQKYPSWFSPVTKQEANDILGVIPLVG